MVEITKFKVGQRCKVLYTWDDMQKDEIVIILSQKPCDDFKNLIGKHESLCCEKCGGTRKIVSCKLNNKCDLGCCGSTEVKRGYPLIPINNTLKSILED